MSASHRIGLGILAALAIGLALAAGDARRESEADRQMVERSLADAELPAQSPESSISPEARIRFAAQLDTGYLERGMDVTVRVGGERSTTLVIKYPLVDRVTAYDFSKSGSLWQDLRKFGFRRLVIGDGLGKEWSWTIE